MSEQNGSGDSPAAAVVHSVSELIHDAVTLAELQGELFKAELHQFRRALLVPIVLLAVAAVVAVGAVPVLLLTLAHALVELAGMSLALSLLIATCVGFGIAAVAGLLGLRKLRSGEMTWKSSREEFSRNIQWLKQVLKLKAHPIDLGCAPRGSEAKSRR